MRDAVLWLGVAIGVILLSALYERLDSSAILSAHPCIQYSGCEASTTEHRLAAS